MHSSIESPLNNGESNCRLRAILVKLQDRLSDDDRKRLHFYLGDDVPRRIRDDQTLLGTLSLMQSLIDQNKINDTDSTYLINAFQVIGCYDLAKILQGFASQARSPGIPSSAVGTIIDQILGECPDGSEVQTPIFHSHLPTKETKRIENEENITLICQGTNSSSFSESESSSDKSLKKNSHRNILRWILPLMILLIISLSLSLYFNVKQYLSIRYSNESSQNYFAMKIKEKDEIIESYEKQINDLPLLYGKIYGISIGKPFDDSKVEGFNSSFFLNQIETYRIDRTRSSYHFIYRSTLHDSKLHGKNIPDTDHFNAPLLFRFNEKTKLFRVTGCVDHRMIRLNNGTYINQTIIDGLEFESDDKEKSFTYTETTGKEKFIEAHHGYSIHYVRGEMSDFIHQIQFVWRYTGNL